jgi:hypothetical protein
MSGEQYMAFHSGASGFERERVIERIFPLKIVSQFKQIKYIFG